MLATLVDEPFSQEGWLFETKFDGERCLAVRDGAEVTLFSRNSKNLNEKYPELVQAFRVQKDKQFAVDGEIVTFEGSITSFAKLQLQCRCSTLRGIAEQGTSLVLCL
jgi:ATP-dependent DNA ligase